MLEKMGAFFDARLQGYEEHQLNVIEGAREFLAFTAEQLPDIPGCAVLDLGCGTGLELDRYFARNPKAHVTGIDLAPGMLAELRRKHPDKDLHLINASYFDTPLGEEIFDAAVSVESLHHFTAAEKLPLYTNVCRALRRGCSFILTDYFALDDDYEAACRAGLLRLKAEQGITDGEFYHYDTPLTVAHETECLLRAGFREVTLLRTWEATSCLRAVR